MAAPSDELRRSLARKLAPTRFPNMSPRLAAIVGYLLDEPFTSPSIVDLVVTSSGGVLALSSDSLRRSQFIGARSDLDRNLVALLNATPDLTSDEIAFFGRLQRARIKRW